LPGVFEDWNEGPNNHQVVKSDSGALLLECPATSIELENGGHV
jgi:hypothetical protein